MALITYQNKVASNTNSGVADVNKVKAEDLNEIKTVVNGNYNEFAPTTLYNNASGSNTSIVISDSSANYNYIEIFYGWGDGTTFGLSSERIYNPNGKKANLKITALNNGYIYIASSLWTISGTSITLNTGEQWRIGTSPNVTRTQTNQIGIVRVLGYKY